MLRHLVLVATLSLAALIAFGLYWELWGAPLRPGGSWLVVKVFPLLLPLSGIVKGRRYTYQWTSMLSLAYVTEGLVRATSDAMPSRAYAAIELVLALTLFVACVAYARLSRREA